MKVEQLIDLADSSAEWSAPYLPPADRIVAGQPWQRVRNVYSSPCGQFHGGEWDCQPGRWRIAYSEHEYCEILSGHSLLIDADGGRKSVGPGCRFLIPAGFRGEWEVIEACHKVYVIFEPQADAQGSS